MTLKQLTKVVLPAIKLSITDCLQFKYIFYVFNKRAELIDAWHCLRGTFIDYLYYNDPNLLKEVTILQLEFRHQVMNEACMSKGSCIKCGCTTTALQAAKKSCKGKCYPEWIDEDRFIYMYCNLGVDNRLYLKQNKIIEQINLNKENELADNLS